MDDMVAMLTALKGVNETLDDDELDNAIEKVTSLVPADRAAELEQSLEQFVVDMQPWGGAPRLRDRVRLLHRAVVERRLVRFTYTSAKGEQTSREVEPMTLILKGYTWYLFGYCRRRDDFRVFRASRMREPELLPERFTRRHASYKDYLESGYPDAGSPAPPVVDLHLRFKPTVKFLVRDYFEDAGPTENPDGTVEVHVSFPDGHWLTSMILGYADQVEVLAPPSIRDRIAECAARIGRIYTDVEQT
jgi:predicted DNA-binding transcriptional regulator YafY